MRLSPRAALLLALLPALPAQQPAGFQRILWLDGTQLQDAGLLQRTKALGFTATNLGRTDDPTPLQQAALGCYLDQPFGKGLLELRDEDYAPLLKAYEHSRDASRLLRPTCLLDEGAILTAVERMTARLSSVPAGMPRFVALADEASVTRHANPLDLCQCDRCLAAFRAFLQRRHKDIDTLNRAWGTEFAGFDDVRPLSTDQVRRRELGGGMLPGNLQPWSEHLEFTDQQFAKVVHKLADKSRRLRPELPVGLTGMQPPSAFGGHDYARLLPGLDLIEAYDIGGATALAASLRPAAMALSTLGPGPQGSPASLPLARLCAAALRGDAAVVVWNGDNVFGKDGAPSPFGQSLQRAFERLGPALDACAGAAVQRSEVWLLESQPSVRAFWMLDSAGDGATWPRRLSSYEATHSTSLATRSSWVHLLGDLGLQPRFVGAADLPVQLLQRPPRLLILPASIAMSDRVCQAIAAYVFAGGRVLADFAPALYNEELVLRRAGALDPLFGIAARSHRLDALLVQQGHSTARLPSGACAAEDRLEADPERTSDRSATVVDRQGRHLVGFERSVGRGTASYLNLAVCDYDRVRLDPDQVLVAIDLRQRVRGALQQAAVKPPFDVRGVDLPTCLERAVLRTRDGRTIYACRLAVLDRPELLSHLGKGGSVPVTVQLPAPRHLRILGGDDLGTADSFEVQLDVYAGLFLVEVTP